MTLGEKIEILLSRKQMSKNEFAQKLGITYRAVANYINGTRNPREETLCKIAALLETSTEFLSDNSQDIELTSAEKFIRNINSEPEKLQAIHFLSQSRGLFAGNALNPDDKEALVKCLIEIYEDSREANE